MFLFSYLDFPHDILNIIYWGSTVLILYHLMLAANCIHICFKKYNIYLNTSCVLDNRVPLNNIRSVWCCAKVCTNSIPIGVLEEMRDVMGTIDRSDRKQLIFNYLAMHTELVSKYFICLCECVCVRVRVRACNVFFINSHMTSQRLTFDDIQMSPNR